jgi:autotransporter-associated beta strand protein
LIRPRLVELENRLAPSTSIPLNPINWTALGPAPGNATGTPVSGRTTSIACDPTNSNIVYVGAASGGVWKTTNANSTPPTWTPLTDGQASLTTGSDSIAIAPSNPSVIYVGTGEPDNSIDSYYGRGVLKSTDGGATWTLFNNGGTFDRKTIARVVVSPTDPNTVYVAVYGGGANGTGGNTGIYRSTNGGTSWTNLTGAISTSAGYSDFEIDPTNTNPNVGYVAVGSAFGNAANGVYVTTNLQANPPTWTLATGVDSGSGNGRTNIAISPSNPNTVYAEIDSPSGSFNILAFYQSIDGGVTWTDRVAGNANFPVGCPSGQGWYDLGLIVDPSNPNTVIITGSASSTRMQRSTDGGVTWSSLLGSGTNPHVDHHALAFDASGRLLDGDDGGVYRLNTVSPISWVSLNGTSSNSATPTALDTNQFVGIAVNPSNANQAIGGTQDNGTQRFNDNLGWTEVDGGDGGDVVWDATNTSFLYRVSPVGSFGTGAFVRRSSNGGSNFSSITNGIVNPNSTQFYPPLILDPAAGSHRVFLGTNVVNVLPDGTVGSPTWSQWGTPPPSTSSIRSLGIGPSNGNTLYLGSNDSNVYVTTDGGNSWQMRTPPSGNSWQGFAVDPNNSNIAYVVSDSFSGSTRIWKTTNAGASWTSLMGSGLPNVPTSAVALDATGSTIYVGNDQGVYRSIDGGATWSEFGNGLPNAIVSSLVVNSTLGVVAVGLYGRGIWEISSGAIYADTRWAGFTNGQAIADADPVAPGNQPATFGINAFASLNAAINAAPLTGTIIVNGASGGNFGNFTEPVNVTKQVTINLQFGPVTFNSLAGNVAGATMNLNGVGLTAGADNTSTEYDGSIAGTGGLTKTGSGSLFLTGADSYSGGTTISNGTLKLGNAAALGATTGAVSVSNGASLDLNGFSDTAGSLVLNGAAANSGAAATLSLSSTAQFAFQTFSTATFAPGITFKLIGSSGGGVQFNADAPTATMNNAGFDFGGQPREVFVASGGRWNLVDVPIGNGGYTLTGPGTLSLQGATASANAGLVTVSAGTLDLDKTAGTVSVGGDLNVNGGTLHLSTSNQIIGTATVTVTSGTFDLNGQAATIGALTGAGGQVSLTGGTSSLTVGGSASTTYGGTLTGPGGLALAGSTQLTLTGANTYGATGGTTINGTATLTVASDAELGDPSGPLVFGGGTLHAAGPITSTRPGSFNAAGTIDTNGNPVSLGGAFGGSGGLTKIGAGTLTLGGANTYTGATAVNAGILLVDGSLASTGSVTVAAGATLGGNGTVGSASVVGVLSPGDGVGTLTAGGVTFNVAGTFSVQLNGLAAGTGYSQLIATGLIRPSSSTLSVAVANGFTPPAGSTFDILVDNGPSPIIGRFAGLAEGATFMAGNQFFTITYAGGASGRDVVLTKIAPPTVANVQINDGAIQRSEVRSLQVTFSGPVTFAGGDANAAAAFQLTHVQNSNNVALTSSVSVVNSQTVVTLTFSGSETDPISISGNANPVAGPSLVDGRYQLTIFGNMVTGTNGQALAGDGTTPGSNYVSPTDTYLGNGLHLYRLFGDASGDGVDDATDVGQLKSTFNFNNTQQQYLAFMDVNNDGVVDAQDVGQFKLRFNTNVFN